MKQKYLFFLLAVLLALFVVLLYVDFQQQSAHENPKNQILLRKIGDELLRSSEDSTSKVLPIQKISTNEFHITFENQLAITPDTLVAIVQRNINQSSFSKDYAVQVLACSTTKVVYGFVHSAQTKETVIPCLGRKLPVGCYTIALQFIPQKTVLSSNKTMLISSIVLVLLVLLIRIGYSKKTKTVPASASGETLQIGKYIFHYEQQVVYYEGLKIPLTVKESKLLYIFFSSPNVIIDRNELQKEVWENEGVIVTRSLDMFISKLRKKLDKDPSVRIVNSHGVGYKLEVG
jgi:hypothetical protein